MTKKKTGPGNYLRRTPEQRRELLDKAQAFMAAGNSQEAAAKHIDLSSGTMRDWFKAAAQGDKMIGAAPAKQPGKAAPKKRSSKRRKHGYARLEPAQRAAALVKYRALLAEGVSKVAASVQVGHAPASLEIWDRGDRAASRANGKAPSGKAGSATKSETRLKLMIADLVIENADLKRRLDA